MSQMTSAQVVKTSINVITNSPSQDYTHLSDHILPTIDSEKPLTVIVVFRFFFFHIEDKKSACAAFITAFNAQFKNSVQILDCNIECCTGNNCNNQSVSVIPPSTTPPSYKSTKSTANGNYTCKKRIGSTYG